MAPWDMQPAITQMRKPRAEVEAEQSRQTHGEVGVAVGINCELRHVFPAILANHSLDGGTGLSLIQEDWLIVEDAPCIADVGVHSNRRGTPTGVSASLPDRTGRFQGHHVR